MIARRTSPTLKTGSILKRTLRVAWSCAPCVFWIGWRCWRVCPTEIYWVWFLAQVAARRGRNDATDKHMAGQDASVQYRMVPPSCINGTKLTEQFKSLEGQIPANWRASQAAVWPTTLTWHMLYRGEYRCTGVLYRQACEEWFHGFRQWQVPELSSQILPGLVMPKSCKTGSALPDMWAMPISEPLNFSTLTTVIRFSFVLPTYSWARLHRFVPGIGAPEKTVKEENMNMYEAPQGMMRCDRLSDCHTLTVINRMPQEMPKRLASTHLLQPNLVFQHLCYGKCTFKQCITYPRLCISKWCLCFLPIPGPLCRSGWNAGESPGLSRTSTHMQTSQDGSWK